MDEIEEEVIYLHAVVELIGTAVNRGLFEVVGTDPHKNILFHTATHRKFFAIVLADFLSPTDSGGPVPQKTYLGALRHIVSNPHFNVSGSVSPLEKTVESFSTWLKVTTEYDAWLPPLEKTVPLRIPRWMLMKIVGNLSKHNFLRAVGVSHDIVKLLKGCGVDVDLNNAIQVQGNVYEHFHDNVFAYHSSTIAEFLNNLRWGIQKYLAPEFARSFTKIGEDGFKYRFKCPTGVNDRFARGCYWDLMNEIRARPFLEEFTVSQGLKEEY